jgi:hypothetical protein
MPCVPITPIRRDVKIHLELERVLFVMVGYCTLSNRQAGGRAGVTRAPSYSVHLSLQGVVCCGRCITADGDRAIFVKSIGLLLHG